MAGKGSATGAMLAIAAILGAAVLVFAWVAGWLSPQRISGATLATALERAAGAPHPGFRRAHAKGVCVGGAFESNGRGTALSRAALFPAGRTPVSGRFSTNAGDPGAPDAKAVFHALGLRLRLADGEEWRMAMDHTPIFIVSNPADFIALQRANTPLPATGKPDPAAMPAFVASHPETGAFLAYVRQTPLPSSFANGTYHSIHAFRFTDGAGHVRFVKWAFQPLTPFSAIAPEALAQQPPDFLFDDLRHRLAAGPLRWRMVVTLANPGDPTDNATRLWTGPHRSVEVGTLTLDRVALESAGDCRDYNFDPLILPRGVAASDDPLLPARSAAYAASFRRRTAEGAHPDALTIAARRAAAASPEQTR